MNVVNKLGGAAGGIANKLTSRIQPMVDSAKPRLRTFLHYARLEMMPPTPADIPTIAREMRQFKRTFDYNALTFREALLYAAVGVEVLLWFFAGEVIGRRHLFGYYIEPKFPPIHLERYHDWKEPEIKDN